MVDYDEARLSVVCRAAAWELCRYDEMAARDYVSLVLSGVRSVTDISMLQTILRQATAAVRRFADPGWRGDGLGELAAALRELLFEAEPDSDFQLAFAQSFVSVATSDDDLGLLSGLLDGSVVP